MSSAAEPAQRQQARRPIARIVPAIPHRLSRRVPAAKPVSPAQPLKDPVTQPEPQPEPQTQPAEEKAEEQPAPPVEAPVPTPEQVTPEAEAGAAASPAPSQDGEVQPTAEAPASTANDGPNDAPNDDPKHVHEALAAEVEAKPLTNGVHRKELPPPFYPSSMSGMNTPVAESHGHVFHPARPSVDGAVGGLVQDSPVHPATPQAFEAGDALRQAVPRIPPGFAPPDFTPSFFPGHSHHPSDAGAPWLYPPYSMPPPPEPMYGNGSDFQSPQFTAGPAAYPEPYPAHFSPEDPRFAANGIATSQSQSPSKSQFGEPLTDRLDVQHAQPQQNGGPRSEEMSESPFELASYLSTQFGNPEFADFLLQVRSPEYQYMSIPVHAIVVVRSPVVANALRRSIPSAHRSRDSRRLADVLTTNPFVASESVQEAVKVLYGAPLLSMQSFLYGLGHYSPEVPHAHVTKDARRRMDQLLSYIAAGSVLQIPSMQVRGVEIAKALLRWDTVEQVLHYGLQATRTTLRSAVDADVRDPFATELLNSAIDFIAYNFPNDFSLHKIAAELRDDPRLPSRADARAQTHNPRLSKIRFGDAPADDDTQVSPVSRTLSTILLSLPPQLLGRLFNHRATANQIGWTGAAKVLHDVVDERENRRQKAAQSQLQLDGTAPSALMENLFLEERVEHVGTSHLHPSGYMITAHRVGA
ncbi:hypothetical protein C7974DRAFT_53385 [Boeremia exigua]|uniref:uncharacterized protein n=1 Tax=Boeremia exigua TaxID=749465 RepID=UPI001E8E6308|nr:uncharacterized protein C7974DRAFT_53385 [Boeremia exigua]KAH6616843.1 hypothetical protein C7974DRAFT_53385 [Boeremia exigua]